ncbi:hypothetical protein ACQY0O_006389 [Thecaphora frezii]
MMAKISAFSSLMAFCAVGGAAAAAMEPHGKRHTVTDFVVFGDSYSDNCNSWRHTQSSPEQAAQWPYPYCPPAPWGRASGNESWPEYIRLQQGQVVPTDKNAPVKPLTKGQWRIQNLAQSSSTCDNAVFPRAPIFDVGQQIDLLKTNYNTAAAASKIQTDPNSSWVAIFIGTNDISFYNTASDVEKETSCLERRLTTLHDFGYRKFLLLENINLQVTPNYAPDGKPDEKIKSYVEGNRASQAKLAKKLNKHWKKDGSEVLIFPTYDLFSRMYEHPKEYNMTTVKVPCSVTQGKTTTTCTDPENYLWANALHPGFHADRILAAKVVRFLEDGARGHNLISGPN